MIGIPIQDDLLLPRILALTAMMPLLYLYGSAVGIFGGFAVAIVMLHLSPSGFETQLLGSLSGEQILFGPGKSVAFGALIAIAGCRIGLRAVRTATDAGQAAISAAVSGMSAWSRWMLCLRFMPMRLGFDVKGRQVFFCRKEVTDFYLAVAA